MKLILSILLLSTLLFASKEVFLKDYKQAFIVAKKENKNIYMLLTSTSCKWCRKFEKKTLTDKKTMEMLQEKFVLLALTRDVDYIPDDFKVKRVPRHYFLTKRGEIIYSFLGYWSPNDFASFITEVDRKE